MVQALLGTGIRRCETTKPVSIPGPDNPYLAFYEMLNKMNRHGVIGNVSATYTFNDHLELMVRSGMDMSFEYRSQQRPFSMTKYPRGMYP